MNAWLSGPATTLDSLVDALVRDADRSTGDDVGVAGELALAWCDFELPGALPLRFTRRYSSTYRQGRWFGASWASWLDQHLELADTTVLLCTSDGRAVRYPAPEPGTRVFPVHGPHWALAWDGTPGGACAVADLRRGVIRYFGTPHRHAARPGTEGVVLPLLAVADRNGNQIDVEYDDAGAPVRIRHSGGYTIDVATAEERIVELRLVGTASATPSADAVQAVVRVRFDYDDHGRLVAETGPDGSTRRFRYDGHGLMTSWTDRTGVTRRYRYDEKRRCVRAAGAEGTAERRFAYHEADRTTTVSDRTGRTWVYATDGHGRIVAETDPLGGRTRRTWDERGRLTEITEPLGRTTGFTYRAGDLAAVVRRPDGSRAALYVDDLGAPVQVVAPDGGLWEFMYDEAGRRTAATDPADGRTLFEYDAYGRLVLCTAPSGQVRTARYDSAGLVIACQDPHGVTTFVDRDAFGRPSRVVVTPDGGQATVSWADDGLPIALNRGTSHDEWTYDHERRVTGHRDNLGALTRVERGRAGLPTAHTTADGVRHVFEYDDELRLTSVTGPDGTRSFRYDELDRLVWERGDDGAETEYRRDAAGRLVARLCRPAVRGNSAATSDSGGRPVRVSYEYDLLDRVVVVTSDGRRDTRHFDALGRMVSRVTPSGLDLSWTYDVYGRPTLLRCGLFVVEFAYDGNGREIERKLGPDLAIIREWDPAGRLRSQTVRRGAPVDAITAALSPALRSRDVWTRIYAYDGHSTAGAPEALPGPAEASRAHGGFHVVVRDPDGTPILAVWPDGTLTRPPNPGDPSPDAQFHELSDALPHCPCSMLRTHDSLDRYLPQGCCPTRGVSWGGIGELRRATDVLARRG